MDRMKRNLLHEYRYIGSEIMKRQKRLNEFKGFGRLCILNQEQMDEWDRARLFLSMYVPIYNRLYQIIIER
jgi:hypothetical protein